ncbi:MULTISPECIES: SA1362 family protein [Gracilibacillus]|uniref:SA1362 family protein n=1 Tax=Gracilibacillus TaxID=74385 RepID=UPI0008244E5F|nr:MULTISPECIES: SA1362 family protein [Gracilibacillus]
MRRNIMSTIIYILIGLAGIGLINMLLSDALGFFISLFISLAIGAAIFGLLYVFVIKRRTAATDDLKKYRKAVKQSKKRYKTVPPSKGAPVTSSFNKKKPQPTKKVTKKRATHLTVIEGNKDKKKNRASL